MLNFEICLGLNGLIRNPEWIKKTKISSRVSNIIICNRNKEILMKYSFARSFISPSNTGPDKIASQSKNWPSQQKSKKRAFLVIFRTSKWLYRVLRWILCPKRPNGPFWWGLDSVETPPSISRNFFDFFAKIGTFGYIFCYKNAFTTTRV